VIKSSPKFAPEKLSTAARAVIEIAKRAENENKEIDVILPDSGERYLSVEWLFRE